MNKSFDIAIVGAGPSGMMAGIFAKNKSNKVCILEKNHSAGKKLLISGKGRCNVTTSKEIPEIVSAFGKKGKFLYGSLTRFSNTDVINFFQSRNVMLKEERGMRIFPVSNKSESILNCLLNEINNKCVDLIYDFSVNNINKTEEGFEVISKNKIINCRKLIIATGGKSYPETGSTGDGYIFAKSLGHTIVTPVPALTPLISGNKELVSLAGLTLKNVDLSFFVDNVIFSKEFGEMLFTHKGISGPIVLKLSRGVYEQLAMGNKVFANIDLKPKLNELTLRQRIHKETLTAPKKEYQSLLATLLPRLLITYAIKATNIEKHKQSSTLNREEISKIINFLKYFRFEITGVESIKRAIVTHGGVPVEEINPKNMESKITKGLYFAGEIICLDGPTGGFNMQKAFSTGYVAGISSSGSN